MRRAVALVLLVALTPALSRAEGAPLAPVVDIPPGNDRIVPVAKGDAAPFAGQLFDTATALRWANWLEQYRTRLKLDVETQAKIDSLEISLLNQKLELERQQYVTVTDELNKRVALLQDELRNPPWYKTTWFGVALGVTGSFMLVGATAWIVHEAR